MTIVTFEVNRSVHLMRARNKNNNQWKEGYYVIEFDCLSTDNNIITVGQKQLLINDDREQLPTRVVIKWSVFLVRQDHPFQMEFLQVFDCNAKTYV